MTEPIPPHSLEQEQCTLGSLLIGFQGEDDPKLAGELLDAVELLAPTDFYRSDHRLVYTAIRNLHAGGKPIDLVTVPEELRRLGKLGDVGGIEYVAELAECVPSAWSIGHYAATVHKRAKVRALWEACAAIRKLDEGDEDYFEEAERLFTGAISGVRKGDKSVSVCEAAEAALQEVQTGGSGVSTGFDGLDEITGKMRPGQLWIVAARPKKGKSAWVAQVVEQTQVDAGIISVEMTRAELGLRFLAGHSGINTLQIQSGRMTEDQRTAVDFAVETLRGSKVRIDDKSGTLVEIRSAARELKRRHGIKLLAVDYLQLVECPKAAKRDNRAAEVGAISRGLKKLAGELNITVIALSQLNRDSERENRRPRLSDLRESGAIEQDANVVIFLHFDQNDPSKAEAIVAANRHGPCSHVEMNWDRHRLRFESVKKGNVA